MSNGGLASVVALLLMLVLVASSFATRRVPMKQTVKMALAWVAIFAVGMLLFSLFDDGGPTPDKAAPVGNFA